MQTRQSSPRGWQTQGPTAIADAWYRAQRLVSPQATGIATMLYLTGFFLWRCNARGARDHPMRRNDMAEAQGLSYHIGSINFT